MQTSFSPFYSFSLFSFDLVISKFLSSTSQILSSLWSILMLMVSFALLILFTVLICSNISVCFFFMISISLFNFSFGSRIAFLIFLNCFSECSCSSLNFLETAFEFFIWANHKSLWLWAVLLRKYCVSLVVSCFLYFSYFSKSSNVVFTFGVALTSPSLLTTDSGIYFLSILLEILSLSQIFCVDMHGPLFLLPLVAEFLNLDAFLQFF